jgi:hypothetical protein
MAIYQEKIRGTPELLSTTPKGKDLLTGLNGG